MVKFGRDFERSLRRVRKVILDLIILGIFILMIQGTIATLTYFYPEFSFLLRLLSLLIEISLMFSAIGIVVKKDSVEMSILRSIHTFKKNFVSCFVFFIMSNIVSVVIILFGTILSFIFLIPTLSDILDFLKSYELLEAFDVPLLKEITSILKQHYLSFTACMVIFSFFLSLQRVFLITSKTLLFLKLSRKSSVNLLSV